MPVKAYLNEPMGVRVHRIYGAVTVEDFLQLAQFYSENPHYAERDLINLVEEDADFRSITLADLPGLSQVFAKMQRGLRTAMIRRSLWVCAESYAWRLLEEWLKDRHSRDGRATELFLVATLEDGDCLYDRAELDAVKRWQNFEHYASFGGD